MAQAAEAKGNVKRFIVASEWQDGLGIVALAQAYIDGQWLSDHMMPEQADAMREQFRRAVLAELEMMCDARRTKG